MLVLGIETTCDETSAAVVKRDDSGQGRILSNVVFSQTAEHQPYGGVVPEIASRAHVDVLDDVIREALDKSGVRLSEMDGIAAAAGPGLIGGVIVGLTTAKAIAVVAEKSLIGVNHLEAHALSPRLTNDVEFPYCLFLASGGHTQILAVLGVGNYQRLGTTLDDAIGEAYDKAAKVLGLGYPGGPAVEQRARAGNPTRFVLPRPMVGRNDCDFSLSGLKTALRLEAERLSPLNNLIVSDLCAAFQVAIVEVVADRVARGLAMFKERCGTPNALVAAGGVASNEAIRGTLRKLAAQADVPLIVPPAELCTDNGAIVAWAGAERLALGLTDSLDISPRARWPLTDLVPPSAAAAAQ
jgi:N6-L-threonylcarbamoyladenine synthase